MDKEQKTNQQLDNLCKRLSNYECEGQMTLEDFGINLNQNENVNVDTDP